MHCMLYTVGRGGGWARELGPLCRNVRWVVHLTFLHSGPASGTGARVSLAHCVEREMGELSLGFNAVCREGLRAGAQIVFFQ